MPRLIIEAPPELQGQVFELTDPEITVGRTQESSLFIDHSSVSNRHATLVFDNGDYQVNDLNSTNGTRINGQRTVKQKLTRGDTIFFGHVQLRYESEVGPEIQPLPEVQNAVELNATGQSARPADFVSAAPFPKPKDDPTAGLAWTLTWIFTATAVAAVGFLAYTMFGAAP